MQNVSWLDSDSTKRDCTAELTQPFVLVIVAMLSDSWLIGNFIKQYFNFSPNV